MKTHTETLRSTPNVKLVRDSHGTEWICDISVDNDQSLSGQGCVRAEEIVYDRMFGG